MTPQTLHNAAARRRAPALAAALLLAACSSRDSATTSDVGDDLATETGVDTPDGADVATDTEPADAPDSDSPDTGETDTAAPDTSDTANSDGDSANSDVTEPDADDTTGTDADDTGEADTAEPAGPCATFTSPQRRGRLPDAVTEVSGLAWSRRHEAVLWMHNDSGDTARVYAVDAASGELRATVALGTTARDWEDMAAGPCAPDDASACLYVGDIGDNDARYPSIVLHRFAEPDLADASDVIADTMYAVYPDGARDAEALLVDAAGTVWILSKERGLSGIYSTPFVAGTEPVELTYHGSIDLTGLIGRSAELATAADYDATLHRVLLRTYTSIVELALPEGAGIDALVTAPQRELPVGLELQGEAIAWGPGAYWHVAEGRNAQMYEIACAIEAQP